jgi:hypothetical protein
MKKLLMLVLFSTLLLPSCAQRKLLVIQGEAKIVRPYGWANAKARKNENVVYEVNAGNVVWSILGIQTVVVPVWLTGWQLFEPVDVRPVND